MDLNITGLRRTAIRHVLDVRDRHFPDVHFNKLPLIGRMRQKIIGSIPEKIVTADGHTLYLDCSNDHSSQVLALKGEYEPCVSAAIAKLAAPGSVAIDIGAHIGQHTLEMARAVRKGYGDTGKVIAFEPSADAFNLLTKNVGANGYANVIERTPVGVADRDAILSFGISEKNHGDHSFYTNGEVRREMSVPVVALDSYLPPNCGPISLIKMDIQGGETPALRGMVETLKFHPSIKLIAEFEPPNFTRSGFKPSEFLDPLKQMGFNAHVMHDPSKRLFPIDYASIEERYNPQNNRSVNLLFSRQSVPEQC